MWILYVFMVQPYGVLLYYHLLNMLLEITKIKKYVHWVSQIVHLGVSTLKRRQSYGSFLINRKSYHEEVCIVKRLSYMGTTFRLSFGSIYQSALCTCICFTTGGLRNNSKVFNVLIICFWYYFLPVFQVRRASSELRQPRWRINQWRWANLPGPHLVHLVEAVENRVLKRRVLIVQCKLSWPIHWKCCRLFWQTFHWLPVQAVMTIS